MKKPTIGIILGLVTYFIFFYLLGFFLVSGMTILGGSFTGSTINDYLSWISFPLLPSCLVTFLLGGKNFNKRTKAVLYLVFIIAVCLLGLFIFSKLLTRT